MSSSDISDLRSTIVPKSDQLNAEQLLTGQMTLRVTEVRMGSDDQPVILHYQGDNGRPYKPCKTMRKVLIYAWGEDGRKWPGKAMTVYCDSGVKFGGMEVGGIRISHLSDIPRDISVSLTATKGKKALHTIKVLRDASRADPIDHAASIKACKDAEALKLAFEAAWTGTRDKDERARFKAAYDAKLAQFAAPKEGSDGGADQPGDETQS